MRRRLLARSLIAALVGSLVAAGTASADTIAGTGSYVDRFGWTYTASVDARSGPHGEEPSGTIVYTAVDQNGVRREHSEATVICLAARGGLATAVGERTLSDPPAHPGQGIAVTVDDGRGAEADGFGVSAPRLSDLGGTCPVLRSFAAVSQGDFVVEDEDPDRVAPVVTFGGTLEVDAESPEGGWVTLAVSAVDELDGPVPAWCDHNEGGLFPIGTHSITCYASDLTGNTGSSTVEVRVLGAADQIDNLRGVLGGLPLPGGHMRSLDGTLAKAGGALALGDVQATCDLMLRFERDLGGLPQKKLSGEQDAELQGDAERIRAVAPCAP
jgi:hypothetical protein